MILRTVTCDSFMPHVAILLDATAPASASASCTAPGVVPARTTLTRSKPGRRWPGVARGLHPCEFCTKDTEGDGLGPT